MKVVVRTPHHESELEAVPKTSLREIFHTMGKSLGIQETWWFGLMYKGPDNEDVWVDKSKKSLKDLQKNLAFNYAVKYYPEDVTEELIESITIEYFFLQVKALILKDEIYCPADTCVLLASYALQVRHGDYLKDQVNEDVFKKQKLLPERVIKQHNMPLSEWETSITNMWLKHRGLDKEDAMLEYLKLVQNLEMYGVSYFNIRNVKGTELLLGVTALGLNIYKVDDRLNPTISFPWSEIKNLKYKGTKFVIRPNDKSAKNFVIITTNEKVSKQILNLGIGNHELYVRRRKPDTPEITRMKEKANEVRKTKLSIRQKYNSERLAREEAEKRETMYKQQLEDMRVEMERKQASLLEAEKTIRKLQEQLEDLKRSKEELEAQRVELQEMMERLERSKTMEAEEKLKLEEEIRAKHEEVQRIQDEVARKDEETRRLQEAIEEAQRKEEEARLRQEEEERRRHEEELRREEERRQRELEEANRTEKELESLPDADNTLPDVKPINDQLKEQLKTLQEQLNATKTNDESELDRIHRINLLEGRDKYKTLRDIRKGNTSRRVEMFENM
ncbi:moesin/ezrin/radixin homolog 1-like [Anthonomus grandis grandis]|uniref:moesin/ezrin/radixin homolog 1-like n=1 Tax=Anthonomus grandis grandis TaxID=2921223 RepID=UPI0021668E6B|nr:moesin/ezrin/radixin homolog 1-like [Anthonomus grandis grandis]XP_050296971.1 moesin/ezrin/radixin homolog 1-like [Anthonomus grandis grandis]XP_050296972.1 moesin/ezrin/radixin homolog 1-like [Anthonomus grandis grandis]XP_050296973.1 moesin/ezrin/radixin homolog 1-like [Anthonomus grandis grandis]